MTDSKRLHGLDLLKFLFIISIVIFHVWENLVYQDAVVRPLTNSLYSVYATLLPTIFHYAGPFLAALSFFLFGYRQSKFSLAKLTVLVLGILLVQYNSHSFSAVFSSSSWNWDVYSFLVVCYIVVHLIPPKRSIQVGVLAISVAMLFISPEFIAEQWGPYVLYFKSAFVLDSAAEIPNGWFLLPWIFLPVGSFCLGGLTRGQESRLKKVSALEIGLFLVLFTILWNLSEQQIPPLFGQSYYKFIFWQQPTYFWLHFCGFWFFVRLNFSERVNAFFAGRYFQYVYKLQWVQNLWLCYFFHFSVLQVVQLYYNRFASVPYSLDMAWLIVLFFTEFAVQIFFRSFKQLQRRRYGPAQA